MTTANTTTPEPITAAQLTIVPANKASWADLQAIFGTADYPGKCYCQRFKTRDCTEVSHPSPRRVVLRIDFAN